MAPCCLLRLSCVLLALCGGAAQQGVRKAGPIDPLDWAEPSSSKVQTLHSEEDYTAFVRSHRLSLIEFVHPSNDESHRLVQRFRQAATDLAPLGVGLAKLDYSEEGVLAFAERSRGAFKFSTYPKLFIGYSGEGAGHQILKAQNLNGPRLDPFGNTVDIYHGGMDAFEIEWWMRQMHLGRNPIAEERSLKVGLYSGTRNYGWPAHYNADLKGQPDSAVREVNPSELAEIAEATDDPTLYLVEFYSDRCPHCKLILDDMVKAANTFRNEGVDVVILGLNSRIWFEEASSWGARPDQELPRMVAVLRGVKVSAKGRPKDGQAVVSWAMKVLEKNEEEEDLTWRERLGRHTWSMLHAMAARYEPTGALAVRWQLASLAENYPCEICRAHLRLKLTSAELGPPRTESREALSLWFCDFHNLVNTDLLKPNFECDISKLDQAYRRPQECALCSSSSSNATTEHHGWDPASFVQLAKKKTTKVFKRKKTAAASSDPGGGEL